MSPTWSYCNESTVLGRKFPDADRLASETSGSLRILYVPCYRTRLCGHQDSFRRLCFWARFAPLRLNHRLGWSDGSALRLRLATGSFYFMPAPRWMLLLMVSARILS